MPTTAHTERKNEMMARYYRKRVEYESLDDLEADHRISGEVAGYLFNLLLNKHWSKSGAIARLHKLIDIFDQTIHRQ